MLTGVFGLPIGWLVAGSVAWKVKGAGNPVSCVIPHVTPSTPFALLVTPWPVSNTPAFTMLANAVAPVPTSTERLAGSTAATRGGGGRHSESSCVANENVPARVPAWRHRPVEI